MKGQEYIQRVYQQLTSADGLEKATITGAFLRAALSIIQEIESPLKEQTLVNLAMLETKHVRTPGKSRRRAA